MITGVLRLHEAQETHSPDMVRSWFSSLNPLGMSLFKPPGHP